jgi:hypothetical protein
VVRKSVAIQDERERGRRSSPLCDTLFVLPAVDAPPAKIPRSKSGFTAPFPSFDPGIADNLRPTRRCLFHELAQSLIAFFHPIRPLLVAAVGSPGCLQDLMYRILLAVLRVVQSPSLQ